VKPGLPPAPVAGVTDGAAPRTPQAAAPPPAVAEQAAPQRSYRVADIVTAALLLALGGVVLDESVRMGIGWGSDGPESGFVPFWLALVLVSCSAFTLVRAARRRSQKRFVRRDQLVRVLQVLLPAAAMLALTPFAGIYVAGALYMFVYMRWAGRFSWPSSVALPLAFMLIVFLIFERWFLVPLPKGPLETWLGY